MAMMKIAVDINQTTGSHGKANADQHLQINKYGYSVVPMPLPYADYCLVTADLQDTVNRRGEKLKKMDLVGDIKVAVDMKASLDEVAMNIQGPEHARFRDECILARKCGCQLHILVCDENIKTVNDVWKWRSRRKGAQTNAAALMKAMQTMSIKYGCRWYFCRHESIGRAIIYLLTGEDPGEQS